MRLPIWCIAFLFLTTAGLGDPVASSLPKGEPVATSTHLLTYDQDEALVRLAFAHSVRHLKRHGTYGFDGYLHDDRDRFDFFVLLGSGWGPPGIEDQGMLASYTVDRQTGDVWDTYADCYVVHFRALTKMQNEMRRKDGITWRKRLRPC
jgi:hypothetical protein